MWCAYMHGGAQWLAPVIFFFLRQGSRMSSWLADSVSLTRRQSPGMLLSLPPSAGIEGAAAVLSPWSVVLI